NAPDSNLRLVLTAADTRDKVQPKELDQALRIATTLAWQALSAADATLSSLAAGGGVEAGPEPGPHPTPRAPRSPPAASSFCCWRRRAPTAAPASAQSFRASHAVAPGTRPLLAGPRAIAVPS